VRKAFINTLCELAAADDRIWVVCGDLGYSVLEAFRDRFPDRFVNAGVAEQNMTGVAAGLALSGKVAVTYSIANFPTLRCLEQIRNDVCYHNANVKIVAVGGGFSYGAQGYTHHGIEDLGVMSSLANMSVLVPADPLEARLATRAMVQHSGPCYLRLGRSGEPSIHQEDFEFELGKPVTVRRGTDLTFIAAGPVLRMALEAADILSDRGISAAVLSMHTVKPIDAEAVRLAARRTGCIVSIEEHSARNGLGTAIADVLARSSPDVSPCSFEKLSLPDELIHEIGDQEYLRKHIGDPVDTAVRLLETRHRGMQQIRHP